MKKFVLERQKISEHNCEMLWSFICGQRGKGVIQCCSNILQRNEKVIIDQVDTGIFTNEVYEIMDAFVLDYSEEEKQAISEN